MRVLYLSFFLALVTVAPCHALTYASWMAGYPSLTGDDALPGADPDADGASNLLEYALAGLDPTVFDSAASLPQILVQRRESDGDYDTATTSYGTIPTGGTAHLVLKWQPRADTTDLELIPEMNSRTLSGWHWGACAFTAWVDGGYHYARAHSPHNLWDRQFLRLRVKVLP